MHGSESPANPASFRSGVDVAVLGVMYAFGLVYLELLWASQTESWLGPGTQDWLGLACGTGGYAVCLLVLGLLVWLPIFLTVRRRRFAWMAGPVVAMAVALVVWHVVRDAWGDVPAPYALGIDAACLVLTIGLLFLTRKGKHAASGFAGTWSLAFVAASVVLVQGAHLFLLDIDRGRLCVALSLAWLAVAGGVGSVLIVGLRRKRAPAILASAVFCALLPAAMRWSPSLAAAFETPASSPSVVLITADALRAESCSVCGGLTPTPALEALARRGALFKHYHTTAPWTVPSLDSLLSGKYPPGLTPGASAEQQSTEEMSYWRLGSYWLDPGGQLLMSRLAKQGYATAAIVGNPAVMLEYWMVQRFDHFHLVDSVWTDTHVRLPHFPFLRSRLAVWFPAFGETAKLDSTDLVRRYAIEFLRQNRGLPVFLWAHFMDPHMPYNPPARFRTRIGQWPVCPPSSAEESPGGVPTWAAGLSEDERQYVRSLYEGEIQYVDEAVGDIVDAVDALGMDGRTYTLFSSDHGEEFWDHDRVVHGHSLYQEQLHVPLILAGPGVEPCTVEQAVSAVDLMPTLAELLDLDASPDWPGTSLAPLMKAGVEARSALDVFAQATDCFTYKLEPRQTVLSNGFKLVRGLESGRIELFHVAGDPDEQYNIAGEHPDLVDELQAKLDEWSGSFPATFGEFEGATDRERTEPSQEMVEIFEGLGYL